MSAFIEFISGAITNRGSFIEPDKIIFNENVPNQYRSVYLYGKEAKEWIEKNETIKGFRGTVALDFVPVDLDYNENDPESMPEQPLTDLRSLLGYMQSEGVELDGLRIYFSGCKGYHVEIPSSILGNPSPSKDIPAKCRAFAERLLSGLKTADLAIVGDHTRIWRLPDSKHIKSGLYKTRLTIKEIQTLSLEDHKKIAVKPRTVEFTEDDEFMSDAFLKGLWDQAPIEKPIIKKQTDDHGLFSTVNGSRHNGAARAIGILLNKDISPNYIKEIISIGFPTLESERPGEIDRIIIDLNKKQNASEKEVNGELIEISDFTKEIFDLYQNGFQSDFSTGWKSMDSLYRIAKGELTIIAGVPGHGKSEFLDAILINLAKNHGHSFAMFSPENYPFAIHFEKLATKYIKKPFFPARTIMGLDRMNTADLSTAINFISQHFRFIKPKENFDLESLILLAKKAVEEKSVDGIIIDPWNEIDHQRPSNMNETDYIHYGLTRLRRFAREYKVFMWVVAHPAKMRRMTDGKFPKVKAYDITGSAGWNNKADNIIIISRLQDNSVEVTIEKIKFKVRGCTGTAFFDYAKPTGIYTESTTKIFAEQSND